jgi:hypothetical protein
MRCLRSELHGDSLCERPALVESMILPTGGQGLSTSDRAEKRQVFQFAWKEAPRGC